MYGYSLSGFSIRVSPNEAITEECPSVPLCYLLVDNTWRNLPGVLWGTLNLSSPVLCDISTPLLGIVLTFQHPFSMVNHLETWANRSSNPITLPPFCTLPPLLWPLTTRASPSPPTHPIYPLFCTLPSPLLWPLTTRASPSPPTHPI